MSIFTAIVLHSYEERLAVGHCNIQGGLTGLSKCLEIQNLIVKEKLDILNINETNLKSDIDTDTLDLPQNFTFVRKDRSTDSGRGGCGMLISNNIKFKIVTLDLVFSTEKIEAFWIHLIDFNVYLCCFYRSEQFCPLDIFLDYMSDCMMKLNYKQVIWVGDVNVNQNNINGICYKKLDITMRLFGLVQTVQEITRIAKLGDKITKSTIDVVMTNSYSKFLSCEVLDNRIGDHQAIKFVLDYNVTKADKFRKLLIRDHCSKNLLALKNFLSSNSNYQPILGCNDVNSATEGLCHHIDKYYDKFCPIKQIKVHSNYLFKPTPELLNEIKKKRKFYKKFKKHNKKHLDEINVDCSKCTELWDVYKVQRNLVTHLSRCNKRSNVINDLQGKCAMNDLKGVWKTIKRASNLSVKATNVTNRLDENKTNEFFTGIGPKIQADVGKNSDGNNFETYLENVPESTTFFSEFEEITSESVSEYLKSIPNDKSTNDVIPLKIFKHILPAVIKPFTHIVNLSLVTGVMPDACKRAIVTPVYKTGDPENPNNYRPISILPILGKTIEYFVNNQLTKFLDDNDIISKHQYGFRKNHSTTYLMLDLFDRIYSSKSKLKKPAIVFLDIKKAFDTVSHTILLSKLKHYGIKGVVYDWFKSFLTGRWQQTRIGTRVSNIGEILCGVPQGSILGPILFSIFINDLPTVCKESTPYLFADDGALYFNNISRGSYDNIKMEFRYVYKWLRANNLALNRDKTKILIFDSSPQLDAVLSEIDENLTLVICECKSHKYLGLVVDNNLNFHEQVGLIKKKVSKRIGAMYRSKNLLPLKFRKMFANALMLPQFDYLDIIWSKTHKNKLHELDVLYKKVAKIALNVDKRESSMEVYKNMAWLPLHLRRQLHLSTYVYRIINEECPHHFVNTFNYISGGSRDGKNCNLYTKKSKSHKEFFYLGAKSWNVLPQHIRESPTVKKFSTVYKNHLMLSMTSDNNYSVDNSFDQLYVPPT